MIQLILKISKKVVLTCILLGVILGCKQKEMPNDKTTIKFSFDNQNSTYEDVFESTEIIQLETNKNCLVSEISQMEICEDKIYILDWRLNALYLFNSKGKFMTSIGKVGRGPGEYIRPRYFFVNEKEKLVKVFDAPTMKLICFDLEGNFEREIKFNNYLRGISETEYGYLGFCSNKANDGVIEEQKKYIKYIEFDKEGKVIKYIRGEESIDRINISNSYLQSNLDNNVSFVEPFMPFIYSVVNDHVEIKYKLDFSGHGPSKSLINRIKKLDYPLNSIEIEFLDELMQNYASIFHAFFENDSWVLLSSNFRNTTLLFNKKTKKTFTFSQLLYSVDNWKTFFTPICLSNGFIYGQVDYRSLKEIIENNRFSNRRNKSLELMLNNMDESDNPLILKYMINE